MFIAAASFALSVNLRLGDEGIDSLTGPLLLPWILFVGVCATVFWLFDAPRGVWRYTSLNDMFAIARVVTLAILLYLLVTFFVTRLDEVPRSTLIINWMVLAALMSAPRLACRLYQDGTLRRLLKDSGNEARIPILLIGAGDPAELFLRETVRDSDTPYRVLGLISEDGSNDGQSIHGCPILGHAGNLGTVLQQLSARGQVPQHLVLTQPLPRETMKGIMEVAEAADVDVARLPRMTDLKRGANRAIEFQPIAVEDLLGRTQMTLDHAAMRRQIEGRRVLVTGAGGSIGSELARQVAALSPSHLCLLDASESLLYKIDLELGELNQVPSRSAVLANVRDLERLNQVMATERPDLVFHAAALKHVPLVEFNKIEGVLSNAIGTRNVADACCQAGVEAMVLISTDKAVNPVNTMGATKRLAEEYCQALNAAQKNFGSLGVVSKGNAAIRHRPRFITVRFGNVLGSNGSVVPLFERQLAAGGPLTITHPDMYRYFMTTKEAVELVLQAVAMGREDPDNDRGSIYVLNMGEPMRILDLANQMIRLAGLKPGEDVEIKVTGVRPGEKLNEELFHSSEFLKPTGHPDLRLAYPRHADLETVREHFDVLAAACCEQNEEKIVWLLQTFVPEFQTMTADQPSLGGVR